METGHAPLPWHAAIVVEIRTETPHVNTISLSVPGWPGHLAGQHLDLRLTSADGYQAQRNYSIASASAAAAVELTIQEVRDGEVSPFVLHEVVVGDVLEVRGPIGRYFTWQPGDGRPLLLVAGGSGVVPLMAMLRERENAGDRTPVRLLYAARDFEAIIYRRELDRLAAASATFFLTYALTRAQPPHWTGERRRIDRAMLEARGFPADLEPRAYICGPAPMVEQVATDLVTLGYRDAWVRTERFGPT